MGQIILNNHIISISWCTLTKECEPRFWFHLEWLSFKNIIQIRECTLPKALNTTSPPPDNNVWIQHLFKGIFKDIIPGCRLSSRYERTLGVGESLMNKWSAQRPIMMPFIRWLVHFWLMWPCPCLTRPNDAPQESFSFALIAL